MRSSALEHRQRFAYREHEIRKRLELPAYDQDRERMEHRLHQIHEERERQCWRHRNRLGNTSSPANRQLTRRPGKGTSKIEAGAAMLTKDTLFGMNTLTLVGLIIMGFGLTLNRMARAGLPLSVGVMGLGTVLVLVGLYTSGWPR